MNHWRIKVSLLANFAVIALLLNSVGAVTLQLQRVEGVSAAAASMLAVFKSAGIFAASLLAMLYLARAGYRRAMLAALAVITVICAAVPRLPAFATLKVLFVAAGVGFAVIKISVYATVGLVTDNEKSHASFMSFLESVFTFGAVSGSFLFGAYARENIGGPHHWLGAFNVLAALGLAALVLLWLTPLDESRLAGAAASESRDPLAVLRQVSAPLVLVFGACVFLYVMIEQSTTNWLPTFNSTVLHLSPALSIQMAALLTVALALGRIVGGIVLRRIHWFPVTVVGLVGAGAVLCLALLARTPDGGSIARWSDAPPAVFLLPVIGFFIAPIYPAINSTVLSVCPVSQQGAVASSGILFSALGSSLGALGFGYLFDRRGGEFAFFCTLLPIIVLLISVALLHRCREHVRHAASPVAPRV